MGLKFATMATNQDAHLNAKSTKGTLVLGGSAKHQYVQPFAETSLKLDRRDVTTEIRRGVRAAGLMQDILASCYRMARPHFAPRHE